MQQNGRSSSACPTRFLIWPATQSAGLGRGVWRLGGMRQFDASLRALQEHNNCDPGDSMRYPQDLKDRDDARRRTDCSVTNGELLPVVFSAVYCLFRQKPAFRIAYEMQHMISSGRQLPLLLHACDSGLCPTTTSCFTRFRLPQSCYSNGPTAAVH